jgi:lysyl-tRNA synthetase class 2
MELGVRITVNGRVVNIRRMGRASFVDILSNGEILQIYLNNELNNYDDVISRNLGTFISVEGDTFTTRTGHNSIRANEIQILLEPENILPIVRNDGDIRYNEIVNVEGIRRRRYLQTILDPTERNTFIIRSQLINIVREYFMSLNYMEVETPILQPIYGGAEATPFITHHESLNNDFFLRIAPELYLRRMLIGGFERVFEIGRNFRNEGISSRHNPEFTVVEAYASFEDYTFSMDVIENLLTTISERFGGEHVYNEHVINLSNIRRVSFREIVNEVCGNVAEEDIITSFENEVERTLINPTIVYDYPSSISPLAMPNQDNPSISERFELFIGGMEIGNAYSELNDVNTHIENNGDDDEDFIEALRYGMPPSTGIGIGIDRLVMILTNRAIRDVIFFPPFRN